MRHVAVRVATAVLAGAAVILGGPVSVLLAQSAFTETVHNAPAPGRPDRHLVVEEGADLIDPIRLVHVDEGTGLATRRRQVGHFNGDDPADALAEAAWARPDRIRPVTDDGAGERRTYVIDLSPETGEPSRTVPAPGSLAHSDRHDAGSAVRYIPEAPAPAVLRQL
ncbi:hypothetical protein ACF08N_18035 [Streptomyces sp. NPDC015127]|uniref:hypothetical protein n=1 Tax=Streptomyces sp. NPDC015127 TaxID=3364939 RepID=UPI0036FA513C